MIWFLASKGLTRLNSLGEIQGPVHRICESDTNGKNHRVLGKKLWKNLARGWKVVADPLLGALPLFSFPKQCCSGFWGQTFALWKVWGCYFWRREGRVVLMCPHTIFKHLKVYVWCLMKQLWANYCLYFRKAGIEGVRGRGGWGMGFFQNKRQRFD